MTASRDFNAHCLQMKQAEAADQARDIWRSAMLNNGLLIQSLQHTLELWNNMSRSQTEAEQDLRQHVNNIFHASQQAQADITSSSHEKTRDMNVAVQAALDEHMESLQIHLDAIRRTTAEAIDREVTDLTQPIQQDVNFLSTELHDLRMAAIDVGTDLISARHEIRCLSGSVQSMQVNTDSVMADLVELSKRSAHMVQDSERSAQAFSELEQRTRHRAASLGSLLDRLLGTRMVMLEAAVRLVLLYAPDMLKSILMPMISCGFRGTFSLTVVLALAVVNATLAFIRFLFRLMSRRHQAQRLDYDISSTCVAPTFVRNQLSVYKSAHRAPTWRTSEPPSSSMTPPAACIAPHHSTPYSLGREANMIYPVSCNSQPPSRQRPYREPLCHQPVNSRTLQALHQNKPRSDSSHPWGDPFLHAAAEVAPEGVTDSFSSISDWRSNVLSVYSSLPEACEESEVENSI